MRLKEVICPQHKPSDHNVMLIDRVLSSLLNHVRRLDSDITCLLINTDNAKFATDPGGGRGHFISN